MRVIAGQHKGRTLQAPKGQRTRPTTDRVRESLFSALASVRGGFEGAVVLDAFAGSGALGIEAASRGAAHVTFCERDRAALAALRHNTAFLDQAAMRVCGGDVLVHPPTPPAAMAFDLVLLDPPYALGPSKVRGLLDVLAQAGSLAVGALVAYEHAPDADLSQFEAPDGLQCACAFERLSSRQHAGSATTIYRKVQP